MSPAHPKRSSPKRPRERAGDRVGFTEDSDASLVERAKSGDRWAREAIFRRHVEAVLALATRLLGRRDEADDVVQDTFTAAFGSFAQLEDPARLKSWLLGTAVHRAKRRLRARKLRAFFSLDHDDGALFDLASSTASPEVLTELALIDALLSRMSVDKRVAWVLRYVEGHKLEEISAMTGASLATVKRHIDAVQSQVRAALEKDETRGEK